MASTWIKRDLSVSETVYKYTWSAWIKRTGLGVAGDLFKTRIDGNNWVQAYLHSNNRLVLQSYKNGGYHYDFMTTQAFRDTFGWYHFVFNVDSSQSSASDRVRIYVNGERITEFSTSNNNLTNGDSLIINGSDSGQAHTIGSWNNGSYFEGLMSHVHYSSGYSYDPTTFGSTDSTTGEWKINTSPNFTLGGNGYSVLKDGITITDQSSNSNDFTVGGGTLTKTEDCPSNVFCTINILDKAPISFSLANGATTLNDSGSADNDNGIKATMGVNSGKYYWEMKKGSGSGGVHAVVTEDVDVRLGNRATSSPASGLWGFQSNGSSAPLVSYINGTFDSTGNTLQGWGANDIIGFALDMDNGKLYLSKNGTFYGLDGNSSDPANATNPAITGIPTGDKFVFPYFEKRSADSPETMCNFGNGFFGTSAITSNSGNGYAADGSLGIFQYQPPTGYTALCTKGLNQ